MTLDLGNSANWEEFYSTTVTAVTLGVSAYVPIREIIVPFSLAFHVLAVKVSTTIPEHKNWKYGGSINQKIELGMGENAFSSSRQLLLDSARLIIFPMYSDVYTLSLSVPSWFRTVSFTIWKYTGIDAASVG